MTCKQRRLAMNDTVRRHRHHHRHGQHITADGQPCALSRHPTCLHQTGALGPPQEAAVDSPATYLSSYCGPGSGPCVNPERQLPGPQQRPLRRRKRERPVLVQPRSPPQAPAAQHQQHQQHRQQQPMQLLGSAGDASGLQRIPAQHAAGPAAADASPRPARLKIVNGSYTLVSADAHDGPGTASGAAVEAEPCAAAPQAAMAQSLKPFRFPAAKQRRQPTAATGQHAEPPPAAERRNQSHADRSTAISAQSTSAQPLSVRQRPGLPALQATVIEELPVDAAALGIAGVSHASGPAALRAADTSAAARGPNAEAAALADSTAASDGGAQPPSDYSRRAYSTATASQPARARSPPVGAVDGQAGSGLKTQPEGVNAAAQSGTSSPPAGPTEAEASAVPPADLPTAAQTPAVSGTEAQPAELHFNHSSSTAARFSRVSAPVAADSNVTVSALATEAQVGTRRMHTVVEGAGVHASA